MDFSGSFTIENSVEAKKLHTKTKKKIRNSYSLAKKSIRIFNSPVGELTALEKMSFGAFTAYWFGQT